MNSAVSTVRAADTSLRILQVIAFADAPMGVTQVANAIGVVKSAAHKHLQTLIEHGMVVQDPLSQHYRLGPKMWLMGQNAPQGQMLAEIALPLMRNVRDELGLAVVLTVPTPKSAFVLATLNSNTPINIGVRPGSELALHASAQGLVLLAFGDPQLFGRLETPLPAITPRTITDLADLARVVERVRGQGYAVAPEQALLGINALAAPILDSGGRLIGTVAFIGSVQHLEPTPSARHIEMLLELTGRISRRVSS